ncbi:MAG: hypothetical protein ACLUEQ_07070 [Cloacibacillus evryensis]
MPKPWRADDNYRLRRAQADGGTRTASITAGFIALFDALRWLRANGRIVSIPLKNQIAAVSVSKVAGAPMLDLCYERGLHGGGRREPCHDRRRGLYRLQGTGEGGSFSYTELAQIIDLGWSGISEIQQRQREILALSEEERELFEKCR